LERFQAAIQMVLLVRCHVARAQHGVLGRDAGGDV
jgi:hypothetical protein